MGQLVRYGEKEEMVGWLVGLELMVGWLVGLELMVMMEAVECFLFQFQKLEPYHLHPRVFEDWN